MIPFILTLTIALLVYTFAFSKGAPTCNHFVMNVYLYLALSVSLCASFIYLYESISWKPPMYVAIILSFVSIIFLSIRPLFSKKGYLTNHFGWLVFLGSVSLLLSPLLEKFKDKVERAFISTFILFLCLTLFANVIPKFLKQTYEKVMAGLMLGLFAIIITELYFILTNQYSDYLKNMMDYIVILLFSVFLLYDTNRLYHYASICVKYPNYPLLSVNLFLDLLNIFSRLLSYE
ncbi:hypothetical protein 162322532 [Organic Lake phycodnavirus 1]|nr:hypothetical protein 162322532 [Organic Lake phycodnavirus 1]